MSCEMTVMWCTLTEKKNNDEDLKDQHKIATNDDPDSQYEEIQLPEMKEPTDPEAGQPQPPGYPSMSDGTIYQDVNPSFEIPEIKLYAQLQLNDEGLDRLSDKCIDFCSMDVDSNSISSDIPYEDYCDIEPYFALDVPTRTDDNPTPASYTRLKIWLSRLSTAFSGLQSVDSNTELKNYGIQLLLVPSCGDKYREIQKMG